MTPTATDTLTDEQKDHLKEVSREDKTMQAIGIQLLACTVISLAMIAVFYISLGIALKVGAYELFFFALAAAAIAWGARKIKRGETKARWVLTIARLVALGYFGIGLLTIALLVVPIFGTLLVYYIREVAKSATKRSNELRAKLGYPLLEEKAA